jgi:dienelactone hydrolase
MKIVERAILARTDGFPATSPIQSAPMCRKRRPKADLSKLSKYPSLILFGGQDHVTLVPAQERLWASFRQNGQPLEWHYYSHAAHGFALADGDGYYPHLAGRVWPLVADFLGRELNSR